MNSSRGNKVYGECSADVDSSCQVPANREAAPDTASNKLIWQPPAQVGLLEPSAVLPFSLETPELGFRQEETLPGPFSTWPSGMRGRSLAAWIWSSLTTQIEVLYRNLLLSFWIAEDYYLPSSQWTYGLPEHVAEVAR